MDLLSLKETFSKSRKQQFNAYQEKLQFLVNALADSKQCLNCERVRSVLSEKLVATKMRYTQEMFCGTIDDQASEYQHGDQEPYYMPDNAKYAIHTFWEEGGVAIQFCVDQAYPAENLIASITEHYQEKGWQPLEFDLCDAIRPGGIIQ